MTNMKIKFKRDTAFRKQFFVSDSFAHPAKMDAQLLIWIVENYTEKGETILDPMAGSGTMMLACTLGRNCVLVEFEDKFCKMMADNWQEVKMRPQLGYQMGNCQIIQGDARNLEGILTDNVIFSPPYAESGMKAPYTKEAVEKMARNWADKHNVSDEAAIRLFKKHFYKGDARQLEGLVDKIVTSPPYAENTHHTDDPQDTEKYRPHRSSRVSGTAGDNPDNLGNLPYGQIDKIVTSPPYEEAMGKKHHSPRADKLAQEKSNPTTYTEVDSIITSPPYEGSISGEGKSESELRELYNQKNVRQSHLTPGRLRHESVISGGYSGSDNNIGNLKSSSYLEAMLQVYHQCYKVLKPQGLMILVTKNFIRNKQIVRLDEDTIKLCEQAGFAYLEGHYRELPSQSFWRVIYHRKHPEVEQINHEDILVFRK